MNGAESKSTVDASGAKVSKEYSIGADELRPGQVVMVFGEHADSGPLHATLLRLIPDGVMQKLPPGRQEGPTFGKIRTLSPMTLETARGEITLETDSYTTYLAERDAMLSDIMPGDSVMLIGGIEKPRRVIIVMQRPGGGMRGGLNSSAPRQKGAPSLPMPSVPRKNFFSRRAMDASLASHFGIKDAVMYRMDLESWYDGYGEDMNDLGIFWMEPAGSFGIGPASVLRGNGSYDWSRFDLLVKNSQAYNIHLSVIIHATEAPEGTSGRVMPSMPRNLQAYKSFVYALVERYDGDGKDDMPGLLYPVKNWKVEDEAMLKTFFQGSGSDYAIVVASAYDAIKSADPSATVILSMLRGYDVLGGDPKKFMDDFFSAIVVLGRGPLWDVMDHHWMIDDDKSTYHLQYRNVAMELADVRASAARHGIAMRPVWSMEVAGLYSDEQDQAVDMFKRFVYAFAIGVDKVFWSGLAESPKLPEGKVAGLAVELFRKSAPIDASGRKKPTYYTLRKLVKEIDGFDSAASGVMLDKDGIVLTRFNVYGADVWIAWNDTPDARSISFMTGQPGSTFMVDSAVPKPESAGDFRSTFAKSGQDGTLQVRLGEQPIIIRKSR